MNTVEILAQAAKLGASDVHITVGRPPIIRLNGTLYPFDAPELAGRIDLIDSDGIKNLAPSDTDALARQIMTAEQYDRLLEKGELDFSYSVPGVARVRVNVFKQRNSIAMVMRLLNTRIPSFQELGLPDVLMHLARRPKGLVLVTGPTGSGKSTLRR